MITREIAAKRLWPKVEKTDTCRLWKGGCVRGGYGRIGTYVDKKIRMFYVHRVVYEHGVGPIPPGLCVCHHCDVKICVNPDHLFLGTQADNNADRDAKGRGTKPPRINVKFSDDDIRNFFRLRAQGRTHQEIADAMGTTCEFTWKVLHRRRRGNVIL